MDRRRESAARSAMVAATLLWGATFVASRDLLRVVGPVELVCARFVVAAAAFAALGLARRLLGRGGALSGLLGAGGFLFQAVGLTSTRAGSSAFLTCVGTVLAALFAWPLLGQRPSAALLQGLVLALAGSFLMSERPGLALGAGEAWTLLGAVAYALQVVVVARWAPGADPVSFTAVQTMTVALTLLPFAGRAPAQILALDAPGLLRFAYLALAGSVAAPLLQVAAQRVLPAGRIALLFALEPVFALLFALTLGGERFAPGWWLGALLILSGVLRVEWPSRAAS